MRTYVMLPDCLLDAVPATAVPSFSANTGAELQLVSCSSNNQHQSPGFHGFSSSFGFFTTTRPAGAKNDDDDDEVGIIGDDASSFIMLAGDTVPKYNTDKG